MNEYVTYKQAKALKAIGYDHICSHCYWDFGYETDIRLCNCTPAGNYNRYNRPNDVIASAPSINMVHKWLREVAGIAINVTAHDGDFYMWEEVYLSNAPESNGLVIIGDLNQYATYEEALSNGISEVLDYLLGLKFKV